MTFEVTTSIHGQPCIEVRNPTKEQRDFLCNAVMDNFTASECYKLHCEAGAFLQCNYSDYVLIEFWLPNYHRFVEWLNKNFKQP